MAEILPFHGVRFDSNRSGPIGPLLAPPYDVPVDVVNGTAYSISAIENVDLDWSGDQHALAARRYRKWLASGVLRRDAVPAFYVHRHRFVDDGVPRQRTGLLARVRLHDWTDRVVLPHEATVPGPSEERLSRLQAVGANLSPLYFLYRDPDGEIRALIEHQAPGIENDVEVDRRGATHRLDLIVDPIVQRRIADQFLGRTLFVADGHHRYEAALAYRDEQRRRFPGQDGPWEYVLALLAAVEDPGVIVWPTHRVLKHGVSGAASELPPLLERWFDVEPADSANSYQAPEVFRAVMPGNDGPRQVRSRLGDPHRALLAAGHGPAWQSLGVSAVEGVLESLLGTNRWTHERAVAPIVEADVAVDQVRGGGADAAFLLAAPSLDRLLAVAEEGDLLPPKSSWFEPKAPAGLVINDLELSTPK